MTALEDGTPLRRPQTDYPELTQILDDVVVLGFWVQRAMLRWVPGSPKSEHVALADLEANLAELAQAAEVARAKVEWRRQVAEAEYEEDRMIRSEEKLDAAWESAGENGD